MVAMKDCDSSNVQSYGYDTGALELHVLYASGATYIYLDVPPHVYAELELAISKGSYLRSHIVNNYGFRRP